MVTVVAIGGIGQATEPEPAQDSSPKIAGSYAVSGVSRDGSTYSSTLTVEPTGANRFFLKWEEPDAAYDGHGALVGNTLYAVWGSRDARCFVIFFDMTDNGDLDGFWFGAADPNPVRGTERAVPAGEAQIGAPTGSYLVEGIAPDGAGYRRELEVTPLEGRFYRFRWSGDPVLEGVGELQDNELQVIASVAGNDGQCGRSMITLEEDGSLSGSWTMNDDDYATLGYETATPK